MTPTLMGARPGHTGRAAEFATVAKLPGGRVVPIQVFAPPANLRRRPLGPGQLPAVAVAELLNDLSLGVEQRQLFAGIA